MARYSIRSTEATVAPVHYVGRECTVCKQPIRDGQRVQDLYVYKLGQLDWIEEQTVQRGTFGSQAVF